MSSPVDPEEKYLLAAYEEYNNDAEEWTNSAKISTIRRRHGSESLPLLIRECGRLVPVHSENCNFVEFHPFNMPEIRVGRVHLIGMILKIKSSDKYVRFEAYDGTGRIEVLYKFERYEKQLKKRSEIDREHKVREEDVAKTERLMKIKIDNKNTSNSAQQRIKQFQRDHVAWWQECCEGMLGRPLVVGSYVHVFGFCNIARSKVSRSVLKDDNFWASGVMPKLIFNAFDVRSVSEKSYNETLLKRLDGVFEERYVDGKRPEATLSNDS